MQGGGRKIDPEHWGQKGFSPVWNFIESGVQDLVESSLSYISAGKPQSVILEWHNIRHEDTL